jgi:signal transduction histidine kinase
VNKWSQFFIKIKQILGIKRLFWRIFFSFWLANLLVMLATSVVLENKHSTEGFNERYDNELLSQAERIVWRYEQSMDMPNLPPSLLKKWISKRDNRREPLKPMLILNDQNQPIYQYRFNNANTTADTQQTLVGPSGRSYHLLSKFPQPPRLFKQVIYRFQSLQFVFIFIMSALVSALLSWSITRPLNYLGSFSRRYANQQEITSLPSKLLTRGDELADLAADIEFMVKKTHEAASTQQQLLHDVSHELRAPLARLQVSAALIEQKNPDNRHVKQINSDCLRIDQLIQQILDFSKLEHTNPAPETCDINALCQHVIDNMAVTYNKTPIVFNADKKCDGKHFLGYSDALLKALDNIIGNACKYSAPGEKVEIETKMQQQNVTIKIRDHGPGVEEQEISKLMQPFYRAGNKMHTDGFGLGLSIALRAIKKHKGELLMTTPKDGGLCVTIILQRISKQ